MQVQCASVVRLNSSCCERVQVLLIDNQKEHAWNCVAMSAQRKEVAHEFDGTADGTQ
jgi:hypothetical protein